MVSRRLLSSLAGSGVVALLMGCNAVVGNEDVEYTETTTKAKPGAGVDAEAPTIDNEGGIEDAEAGPGDNEDLVDSSLFDASAAD